MKTLSVLILSVLIMAMKKNIDFDKYNSSNIKAEDILKKVSNKLNSFKSISYDYFYETKYFSENDSFNTQAKIYLDFTRKDTLIGFNYQIENKNTKFVFNGSESFFIDKDQKTIEVNNKPKQGDFNSIIFFSNSIATLKNVLPSIISDKKLVKTISDTIINNKPFYVVSFTPKKKVIDPLGKSFSSMTIERNLTYRIIIDKKNHLPTAIIQTFSDNKDFQKTTFTNIKEANKPSELSWYYSTYTNNYSLALPKQRIKLISQNTIAPNWTLPILNETKTTASLYQLKGTVILLEFWIKNCGYCIAAVSKLNELQTKYENKNFQILGINSYDSKEAIDFFYNKNKPTYKILYGGDSVVSEYGVTAFPTVILIDKEGKVIYSGSFDKSKIESLVDKAL